MGPYPKADRKVAPQIVRRSWNPFRDGFCTEPAGPSAPMLSDKHRKKVPLGVRPCTSIGTVRTDLSRRKFRGTRIRHRTTLARVSGNSIPRASSPATDASRRRKRRNGTLESRIVAHRKSRVIPTFAGSGERTAPSFTDGPSVPRSSTPTAGGWLLRMAVNASRVG